MKKRAMQLPGRFEIDHFSPWPAYLQLGQKVLAAWFSGCLSQDPGAPVVEGELSWQPVPEEAVRMALELLEEVGLSEVIMEK